MFLTWTSGVKSYNEIFPGNPLCMEKPQTLMKEPLGMLFFSKSGVPFRKTPVSMVETGKK